MSELAEEAAEAGARPAGEGRRRRSRKGAWWAAIALAALIAAAVLLATMNGLAGLAPRSVGTPSSSASPSASTPSTAPTRPPLVRFDPSASDAENLQLFGSALTKAVQSASPSSVSAKTLTDALAGVGFSPASMQRTADQTSANLQAPTLVVSVRLGGSCLIGQFVRSEASVSTELAAPIGTGACLIGKTAPMG